MERILELQPQIEIPVTHHFGDNLYVREITLKKGTFFTGRVHKLRHVSLILKGHMTLWTPIKGIHDVRGPLIEEVEPGMKRVGYVHEDTVWSCAYSIPNVDDLHQEELLEAITFKYYGEYLDFINIRTFEG
jgi:hypothetical protein